MMPNASTSKFTAIRHILATTPKRFQIRMSRWGRLDQSGLLALVQELEEGNHLVQPQTLYALRQRLYEMETVEFSNRLSRVARTPEEDRYEEEHEPEAPRRPVRTWRGRAQYVCLQDGRRAKRLDLFRALPLCGLRSPVVLSEVEQHGGAWQTGSKQCPVCYGHHLHDRPTPSVQSPVEATQKTYPVCGHCQSPILLTQWIGTSRYGFGEVHCRCGYSVFQESVGVDLPAEDLVTNEAILASRSFQHDLDELTATVPLNDCIEASLSEIQEPSIPEVMFEQVERYGEADVDEMYAEGMTELTLDCEESVDATDEDIQNADDPAQIDHTLPDHDEHLVALQNKLWENRYLKPLRCALLEAVIAQDLPSPRVDLLWAAASVLVESCEGMKGTQQKDVAMWLVAATDRDLRDLLPSTDLMTELTTETTEHVLPPVTGKIKQWRTACRIRLARFHYPRAGARILAPKFGVSEAVFLKASGY